MNSLINPADNELAGDLPEATIESSNSLALIFQLPSCGSTPSPTPDPALGLALDLALDLASAVGRYTDKNLQKAIKLTLEFFFQDQEYTQH